MEDICEREKLAYIGDDRKAKTAGDVVRILNKHLDFKSVIDLGCGTGVYVREFKKIGKNVLGVDGNRDADPPILADLRDKQPLADVYMPGGFDMSFSIEVAEHIEPNYADIFTKNLKINSKKWIVMTTCPPNRSWSKYTEVAHLNEQPKKYWIDRIQDNKWKYRHELTEKLQGEFCEITGMMKWFNHDLMIFECVDL